MKKILLATLLAAGFAGQAMATTTYFSDNFANLDAWVAKPGYSLAYTTGNQLTFSSGNSAGDIFTRQTFNAGYFNFDYKGVAGVDGGGYFGISTGLPDNHYWIAGSSSSYSTPVNLVNDGQYHHYSVAFNSSVLGGAPVHMMLEQFATNTPNSAWFRNVSVSDAPVASVPEPETWALLALGLAACAWARRRKSA